VIGRALLAAVLLLAACATVRREPGRTAFYQACVDATTDAVVLNLAAHPDDEAARTLVYLRRKYGLRTYTLYSTCGGGGQNAIGAEIGEDLARVRTRETLAAARITGTQVRWLGFEDFGYSKTAAETFQTWGRQRFLDALDKALDEIRPDVIFINHGADRGHGHHRATAIAARELVARRPGLLLYERMPGDIWFEKPDASGGPTSPDVVFPVGEVDPSTGESYARQAMRGWRMHRTQGMGAIGAWRMRADAWKQVLPAGENRRFDPSRLPSLFDSEKFRAHAQKQGIDPVQLEVELGRFKSDRPIPVHVARARTLLPTLRQLRNGCPDVIAARLDRRIDALEKVILDGLGIGMVVTLEQERIPVGGSGTLTLKAWSPDVSPDVTIEDLRLRPPGGAWVQASSSTATCTGTTGPLLSVDPALVWPATLRPTVAFRVGGIAFCREVELFFTPVPTARLAFEPEVLMLPAGRQPERRTVELDVVWNGEGTLESRLEFDAPPGIAVEARPQVLKLTPEQRRAKVETHVTLEAGGEATSESTSRGRLQVVARLESNSAGTTNGGAAAVARLDMSRVEFRRPRALHIGLVRGPDDTLHQALESLHLDYQLLDPVTLKAVDLSRFTTVVVDMRAYRSRRDLVDQRERILDFCRNGGRVVCFYHKPQEWNAHENQPLLAPYDLHVGHRRVSQENAPVRLLDSGHRIWSYPNKITIEDFDGWVQERGVNFPEHWGKEWVALLETADRGEKPLRGGLLYAEHGKGDFVYCALVLYRQLRLGHAGAARILVNLLSR